MILNETFLRNEAKKIYNLDKFELLLENKYFAANQRYDLFISHSFQDKELVEVLYNKFKEAGYRVYIDWKEETLQNRGNVSSETAKILKNHMNNCLGLLYIATASITNSKWCPWELGYADGKKNTAAILPILKDEHSQYKGQEYLGIYPYVDYNKNKKGKYDFFVNDENDERKYTTLRDWLEGGALRIHE